MNPRIRKLLPILGPGWIVMMADLDAPSAITAIQSGIQYQGHLIIFLFVLILPLFLVQDTSSRIGEVTGKSLGKIITENYGHFWTMAAVAGTVVIDFTAYAAEFAGIAIAASILGMPVLLTVLGVIVIHTAVITTGVYRKIEIFLLVISFLLFLFVVLDIFVRPLHVSLGDFNPYVPQNSFYFLMAANIGAVIMPWMLFYHQAADVDRGLSVKDMKRESKGTLMGAIVSEILMVSILVFSWRLANLGISSQNSVRDVANELGRIIGPLGPIIFAVALGISGLLAMFVISMSMSYSMSDALKIKGTFNQGFRKGKLFYSIYLFEIIPAAILTLVFTDLIGLALDVMVLSSIALVLPLLAVIRIASDRNIMGRYTVSRARTVALYIIMVLSVALGTVSFLSL